MTRWLVVFALGLVAATGACGYLSDHPPQICVTADQIADGGVREGGNPGY